jgi:hypothetical protein
MLHNEQFWFWKTFRQNRYNERQEQMAREIERQQQQ